MLKKLEVEALRGATKKFVLPFEHGKRITIVYGENGAGKSTICDAIEFVCQGTISSLDDRGLGRTEGYWPSTGKTQNDIVVAIEASNGTWVGKFVGAKPKSSPSTGLPFVQVLRRGKVLNFIASQPKNRYDAISPFIDISQIELSEASLRRLLETEQRNRETAITRVTENLAAVENFWKQAGSPGDDGLSWAQIELTKDVAAIKADVAKMEDLVRVMENLARAKGNVDTAAAQVSTAQQTYDAAHNKAETARLSSPEQIAEIVPILEAAQAYFHSHSNPTECPLCTSKEFAPGLTDKVTQQLSSVRIFREAVEQERTSIQSLIFAKQSAESQKAALLTAAKDTAERLQETMPSDITVPPALLESAQAFAATSSLEFAERLKNLSDTFGTSLKTNLDKRKESIGFLDTLKRAVAMHDENLTVATDLAKLIPRISTTLDEVEIVRRGFVDTILGKISTRVGTLYETIHPGEGLNKISLLLDPAKRASLDVRSSFPGTTGAPPPAYFSDSHLDTLGLCIWLALAEMRDPGNTILVLDDIVTSADEPHVERIIELLYEISESFKHCVFTTHYQAWRAKYRWGWIKNGECHFVELLKWEHATGLQLVGSLPPIEELRDLLGKNPPSPQQVCASAGVTLEAILDFITLLYECSVPRRKSNPTLGDLLPSIKAKLRVALKVDRQNIAADGTTTTVTIPLGPLLDELERIAQARNVFGCHFNQIAQHLPETDAIQFATVTLELADNLIDPQVGWPRSDKSGNDWANAKKTRILHPLKQPS